MAKLEIPDVGTIDTTDPRFVEVYPETAKLLALQGSPLDMGVIVGSLIVSIAGLESRIVQLEGRSLPAEVVEP